MGAIALTKREQEVLELMALGLANKEIALRLSLSPRTVETHADHILSKLNAPSRTRAVIAAGLAGLLGDRSPTESSETQAPSVKPRPQRFVGRRQELTALNERLQAAIDGRGSVLLIGGEAGSGKSRLVAEFLGTVSTPRARHAVGQCLEYAQSPLAPFLAVLATLKAQTPNISLPHEHTPSSDKLEQFNALAESFSRLAAAQPVVVVLEDAHWADSASLDLLLHLSSLVGSSKLLLLVTHRTEELRREHPLRGALVKLERNKAVTRYVLDPLSRAEISTLLADALGDREPPSAAAMETICMQSEGNPLFAEELLKTVLESYVDSVRVPVTLRDAVLARLDVLDERDRTTLAHAAAVGRRFDAHFLSQIVNIPISATLSTLKRAMDLQLVDEEPGDAALFAFRHELTRRSIYGELLAAEARPLHRRIAVALEAAESDGHVAELAYHYWVAREAGKALTYNERAGDKAMSLFGFRDAVANYERAIGAGPLEPLARAALEEKLAGALFSAGSGERATRLRESVLEFYERTGERKRAAAVCLDLARTIAVLGDAVGQQQYVERALQFIESDQTNPAFFDAHLELMALYVCWRWDPQKARAHAMIAEPAGAFQAPPSQIRFHEIRMLMHLALGEISEAVADGQRAVILAEQSADWRSALRVWANMASVMAQDGERAIAIDASKRALEIIRRQQITGLTPVWSLMELALVHATHGDLKAAAALLEEARFQEIDVRSFSLRWALVAIPLGIALEDETLARSGARRELVEYALRSSNPEIIGELSGFVELDLAQGRRQEAAALLTRALHALEASDARPAPGDIEAFLLLVAQHGEPDEVAGARAILDRIAASSSTRATPAYSALFDAFQGLRFGDHARAVANAVRAAGLFHAIGWPVHEARALEAAGRQREALQIFRQVGAVHDVRRVEAALSPTDAEGRTTGKMTARERQIHDLLVRGNSNKAIAGLLKLSERTVASHVSSILMKAGAASRSELVARAVQRPRKI